MTVHDQHRCSTRDVFRDVAFSKFSINACQCHKSRSRSPEVRGLAQRLLWTYEAAKYDIYNV